MSQKAQKALALTQNFRRVIDQFAGNWTREDLSLVRTRTTVKYGFPFDAYNARACLTPTRLMSMFEGVRIDNLFSDAQTPSLAGLNNVKNRFFFAASTTLKMAPEIYEGHTNNCPIQVDTALSHVGRTSFKFSSEMSFPYNPKPLVFQEATVVFVNPETRRAQEPPQWWKEKYSPLVEARGSPLLLPKFEKLPDKDVVEMEYIVQPSDIDSYCHLSSSKFIHVCTECYIQWHIKTFGFEGKGDPFRNVSEMVQTFEGEATAGDVLTVKFWPKKEDENVYNFVILKGQKVISNTVVTFLPSTDTFQAHL